MVGIIDMAQPSEIKIGNRFESEGYRGTVLFIGEVPPTKGDVLMFVFLYLSPYTDTCFIIF